jgi:hypothetical protein
MLALSASYGVYSFASLYAPTWIAVTQAGALELVYIGLAVAELRRQEDIQRARAISIGAVSVSALYNALAGLFHRAPDLLVNMPLLGEIALTLAHALPIPILCYLVADLLFHRHAPPAQSPVITPPQQAHALPTEVYARPAALPEAVPSVAPQAWHAEARRLKSEGVSARQIAQQLNLSPSTVTRYLNSLEDAND